MVLYMETTKDKYQLPVAVADSIKELSLITGVAYNSIASSISHEKRSKKKSNRFHRIEVEDD